MILRAEMKTTITSKIDHSAANEQKSRTQTLHEQKNENLHFSISFQHTHQNQFHGLRLVNYTPCLPNKINKYKD